MSPQANELLLKNYPEFRTESRGEVIIKVEPGSKSNNEIIQGKGVMETFWLLFD